MTAYRAEMGTVKKTSLDDGHRLRYRGEYKDVDVALDDLCEIIDTRRRDWRVRNASIKCPVDRGLRIYLQVGLVSPGWVSEARTRRKKSPTPEPRGRT